MKLELRSTVHSNSTYIALCMLLISALASDVNCHLCSAFSTKDGHILSGNSFKSIKASQAECAMACNRDLNCKSANFKKSESLCLLNSVSCETEYLMENNDYIFYERNISLSNCTVSIIFSLNHLLNYYYLYIFYYIFNLK